MKTFVIAATALAIASPAFAGPTKKTAGVTPKEPIPYGALTDYRDATPRERASRDWNATASANTGVTADISATEAEPKEKTGFHEKPAEPAEREAPEALVPQDDPPT